MDNLIQIEWFYYIQFTIIHENSDTNYSFLKILIKLWKKPDQPRVTKHLIHLEWGLSKDNWIDLFNWQFNTNRVFLSFYDYFRWFMKILILLIFENPDQKIFKVSLKDFSIILLIYLKSISMRILDNLIQIEYFYHFTTISGVLWKF